MTDFPAPTESAWGAAASSGWGAPTGFAAPAPFDQTGGFPQPDNTGFHQQAGGVAQAQGYPTADAPATHAFGQVQPVYNSQSGIAPMVAPMSNNMAQPPQNQGQYSNTAQYHSQSQGQYPNTAQGQAPAPFQGQGQAPAPFQGQGQYLSQSQQPNQGQGQYQNTAQGQQGQYPNTAQAPYYSQSGNFANPGAAADALGLPPITNAPPQRTPVNALPPQSEEQYKKELRSVTGAPLPEVTPSKLFLMPVPLKPPVPPTFNPEESVENYKAQLIIGKSRNIDISRFLTMDQARALPAELVNAICQAIPPPVLDEQSKEWRTAWSAWHTASVIRRATPAKQDIYVDAVYEGTVMPAHLTVCKTRNWESIRIVEDPLDKDGKVAEIPRGMGSKTTFPALKVQMDVGRPGFQYLTAFRLQCPLLYTPNGLISRPPKEIKPDEIPKFKFNVIFNLDPKVPEEAELIELLKKIYEGFLDLLRQYEPQLGTKPFNSADLASTLRPLVSPQINATTKVRLPGKPDVFWTECYDYTEGRTKDAKYTQFRARSGKEVSWTTMGKTGAKAYPLVTFSRLQKAANEPQIKVLLDSMVIHDVVQKAQGADQTEFIKEMYGNGAENELSSQQMDEIFELMGNNLEDDGDINKIAAMAMRKIQQRNNNPGAANPLTGGDAAAAEAGIESDAGPSVPQRNTGAPQQSRPNQPMPGMGGYGSQRPGQSQAGQQQGGYPQANYGQQQGGYPQSNYGQQQAYPPQGGFPPQQGAQAGFPPQQTGQQQSYPPQGGQGGFPPQTYPSQSQQTGPQGSAPTQPAYNTQQGQQQQYGPQ